MKRAPSFVFRVAVAGIFLCCGVSGMRAQTPGVTLSNPPGPKELPKAPEKAEAPPENPFAAVPAPPLPAGMAGSDASDPRAKLTPGLYDAGEASMGIKHVMLLKKPDSFQLGSD
jgi:hypothetical protein